MKSIDFHQDLLLHLRRRDLFREQTLQTSFDNIQKHDVKIIVASGFALPDNDNVFDDCVPDLLEKDFAMYHHMCSGNSPWRIITDASDVASIVHHDHVYGIVLHVEGLNVKGILSWKRFEQWYAQGWRSVGMLWNCSNAFGGGVADPGSELTLLGRDFLKWANAHHMIIDCAHMNRKTFWEAINVFNGPVVVSHGNADALCAHERNYTDDQLRVIAERDGIIGVFLSSKFLHPSGSASLDDVVAHIDYLCNVIGVKHVALGSDFGGITSGVPKGLAGVHELSNLWDALQQRGYLEHHIEAIAYKNAQRVLETILQ